MIVRLSIFTCLLCSAFPTQGVLPLRDQWKAACRAFQAGEAARALALFKEFEQWYAQEPEVSDAEFNERRIRLWGLAALQSGNVHDGAALLERWLSENPTQTKYRAYLRFQVASAYLSLAETDKAITHWTSFLSDHPATPECILVHWIWADVLLSQSGYTEAGEHLRAALIHPQLPDSGRALIEVALGLIEIQQGNAESASRWLSGSDPPTQIHRLWRAILAPSLAKQFIREDSPEKAADIVHWFDLPKNLTRQINSLIPTPAGASTSLRQSVWNQHWRTQAFRLQSAVSDATESVELEAALYSLRLQALLRAKKAHDAYVLSTALLRSNATSAKSLRSVAYSGAIESCHIRQDWPQAEKLAQAFLEAFPDHPDLPDILFLQAQTAAGLNDLGLAISKGDQLLDLYPDHRSSNGWAIATAGWRLEAGHGENALEDFIVLESVAPKAWLPFIQFQQGRCHESCGRLSDAVRMFTDITRSKTGSPSLREQAWTRLLKVYLRTRDDAMFLQKLDRYRTEFPDGQSRILVETIAGSFHTQRGNLDQAVAIYTAVARETHPAASFACDELSRIYRGLSDYSALQEMAIGRIQKLLAEGTPLPDAPFRDCLFVQDALKTPALREELLRSLMDVVDSPECHLSGIAFFSLLENRWKEYRKILGAPDASLNTWVDLQANRHRAAAAWRPYAVYQLFAADLLSRQGRPDSADTKRIEILQAVVPQLLNEEGFHTIAATAHAYDFPETAQLLTDFLQHFPQSAHRPDSLYKLAQLRRASSLQDQATALLEEILKEWPDSPVYNSACLRLAKWHLQDLKHDQANGILESILDRSNLPPVMVAEGLLLRSRADLLAGNLARCRVNCQRILQLYPAFRDIARDAAGILLQSPEPMDSATRKSIRILIQTALPEYQFPETGGPHA